MRVFIAGATGVYGQAVIPRLVARGDTAVALARDPGRVPELGGPQVELVEGDLVHGPVERLTELMGGCDAAMHLATAIRPGATGPDGANTTAALRTTGTRHILDAVLAAGVPVYLQQSIVMAYVDGGDRWLDEDTPFETAADRATTTSPVVEMEAMVRALDPREVRWCILRGGSFVGPGTAQDAVLERLRAGTQRVPGDGSNWVSFIHVEDIAEATVAALDRAPAGSVFNITDAPIRNGDYLDRLAELAGVAAPARDATAPLPRSFRCSSEAARRVLAWEPSAGIWPKTR
ncbi:MAG: NAD(P)-dependent oxidoreductase [Dehalococcoidia bacterium]|nr:NAD(P)-dependent oxidoreductase [Dehalococcoidia bacterium]